MQAGQAALRRRTSTRKRGPGQPAAMVNASGRWLWFRAASDPFRLVLAFIILIDISRIHQQFGFLQPFRPALLSFLVGVGLAVLKPKYLDWRNLKGTWHPKAVVVFTGIALLSVPFGISLGGSAVFFLDVYSKILVTAFLILAGIRSPEHLKLIVWTYVLCCGIWIIMAFTVFDLQPAGDQMRLADLHAFDANDLGLVLVVGIPLTLWMMHGSHGLTKLLLVSIIMGIGATIALTGSRGALVGLSATALALLFLSRHISAAKRLGFVGVMILGLVVTAPPGYWQQMETILNPQDDYNLTDPVGRKAIALRGLRYMSQFPIFGLGMNNFGRAEGTIGRTEDARSGIGVAWIAPHNTYVQVGAELGVFALAIWLSLLLAGIVGLARLRNRLPRRWLKGTPRQQFLYTGTIFVPASFVAFASSSVFLSFAYLLPIYLLVGIMTTLHIFVKRELREERELAAAGPALVLPPEGPVVRGPLRTPRGTILR